MPGYNMWEENQLPIADLEKMRADGKHSSTFDSLFGLCTGKPKAYSGILQAI
ncbi:MAG: hypothetical protein M9904_04560 [Chitinophagaceae bacterium]|nr:hypothetical protein [Chitinophagaceae bacterium]